MAKYSGLGFLFRKRNSKYSFILLCQEIEVWNVPPLVFFQMGQVKETGNG
jgi:hypothetical protein